MYADQIDNESRREIFIKLCKAEYLKYSQLKPNEMESNHFAYHLKKLKEDGFIEKSDKNGYYRLAPKGLRLADVLSYKTEMIRAQPKIIILLIVTSSDGKNTLVGLRQRQPHFGKKVLPGGKIHFGETTEQAASRMIKEFLPNSNSVATHRGNFYLFFRKGKINVSHIYAHVFSLQLMSSGEENIPDISDDQSNKLLWDDLSSVEFDEEWVLGTKEVLEALKQDEFFEMELEFDI
jgi:ADP-ribose pyrophosphatase YjhB (NUDIX family)